MKKINWLTINLKTVTDKELVEAREEYGKVSDLFLEKNNFDDTARNALSRIETEIAKRDNFDIWLNTQPKSEWKKILEKEIRENKNALAFFKISDKKWEKLNNQKIKLSSKLHSFLIFLKEIKKGINEMSKKMEMFIPLTPQWLDHWDKINELEAELK